MSNNAEQSRLPQLKGPLLCAIGGLFTVASLAYAIHVAAYPSHFTQVQFIWALLLITAPIGFFFLSLGIQYLLQQRRK
ncbi:MAG: hypothetical protein ACFFCH_10260 [Promethearchaeota archaeon]